MHSQLLIFDEAHMYLSECRSSIIDYLTSKLDRIIVGFTATQQFSTTRANKARSSVDQVFNPPIFRYTIDQGVKNGFLHPVRVENIDLPSFKDAVKNQATLLFVFRYLQILNIKISRECYLRIGIILVKVYIGLELILLFCFERA